MGLDRMPMPGSDLTDVSGMRQWGRSWRARQPFVDAHLSLETPALFREPLTRPE